MTLRSREEEKTFQDALEVGSLSPEEEDKLDVELDRFGEVKNAPLEAELEAAKERARLLEVQHKNVVGVLKDSGVSVTDSDSLLRTLPSTLKGQVAEYKELVELQKKASADNSFVGAIRKNVGGFFGVNPLKDRMDIVRAEIVNDRSFLTMAVKDRAILAKSVEAEDPATIHAQQAKILQDVAGTAPKRQAQVLENEANTSAIAGLVANYKEEHPEKVQGLDDKEVQALAIAARVKSEGDYKADTLKYKNEELKVRKLESQGRTERLKQESQDRKEGRVITKERNDLARQEIELKRIELSKGGSSTKAMKVRKKTAETVRVAAQTAVATADAEGIPVSPSLRAISEGKTPIHLNTPEELANSDNIARHSPMLKLIRKGEANGEEPYESWAHNRVPKGFKGRPTTTTIKSLWGSIQGNKHAVGGYQFQADALKESAERLIIFNDSTFFTPEVQDLLAIDYMEFHGKIGKYMEGGRTEKDMDDVQLRLSKKWCAIANPETGKTSCKGDNGSSIQVPEFRSMLKELEDSWEIIDSDGAKSVEDARAEVLRESALISTEVKNKNTQGVEDRAQLRKEDTRTYNEKKLAEKEAKLRDTPEYRAKEAMVKEVEDSKAFSLKVTDGKSDQLTPLEGYSYVRVTEDGKYKGSRGEALDTLSLNLGESITSSTLDPKLYKGAKFLVEDYANTTATIAGKKGYKTSLYKTELTYRTRPLHEDERIVMHRWNPKGVTTGKDDWDSFVDSKSKGVTFGELVMFSVSKGGNRLEQVRDLQDYLIASSAARQADPIRKFIGETQNPNDPREKFMVQVEGWMTVFSGVTLKPFDALDPQNIDKLLIAYERIDTGMRMHIEIGDSIKGEVQKSLRGR